MIGIVGVDTPPAESEAYRVRRRMDVRSLANR
jgi:hypothetical protein